MNSYTEKALNNFQQGKIEEAIGCLKKAVAVNDVAAQYYLGLCFEYGIGINSDFSAAFGMYRRAAERGLVPAMKELSRCYQEGIGVQQNINRANEWQTRFASRYKGVELPDILYVRNMAMSLTEDGENENSQSPVQPPKPVAVPENYSDNSKKESYPSQPTLQIEGGKSMNHIVRQQPISDVDIEIPITNIKSEGTFALIIANEHYQDVANVPHALNDGEIFASYCQNTLGIPSTNIHLIKDATLNNIKREVSLMKQIGEAYEGHASFIIYYAGHGIPDEKTKSAFLLPVDGYSSDISTCYSLKHLYDAVGSIPSVKTIIMLDACFSGATRGERMLASARGVAIKAKAGVPTGNTVVISSAQGDETAYQYDEMNHGLFTYFLLKKIKESRGSVAMGELADYLRDNVKKKSLIVNGKSQTPTAVPSTILDDKWVEWKLN